MNTQQTDNDLESPEQLAARLLPGFSNLLLLSRALTHRSYLNEHPEALEDNERLEFLGDAVLDFVVGAWLYNRYPEMPEGDLTRMRSALVHTAQLAEFARKIDLGKAMRLGRGEWQAGGSERSGLLCDTFEAVIGALYLDQNIVGVMKFIEPILSAASDDILLNHKDEDPKSKLQEWAQGKGYQSPHYLTRNTSGPDHSKLFEVDVYIDGKVSGSGIGHSKQAATKQAAIAALNKLGLLENTSRQMREN
ncbi:MAG: ribonuclease III [Chloroflexi bacterium]|nr:MAG: ribonuclease III [Chloroflexota bacterium]